MTQPSSESAAVSPIRERVEAVINQLRTMLQADGGDLELVDVTAEGGVLVRFHGACVGCPGMERTLRMGIERTLRARVPEITEVSAVSDR